jgi:hypothetical protein
MILADIRSRCDPGRMQLWDEGLNPRKLIGAVALGLLLLLGLGIRYIAGVSQDHWHPLWRLAYVLGLGVAFFTAFYDRKDFLEKTWDFDPKRGILYFFLGWIIFPVMIGIEAISGTDITLGGMVLVTLAMSVLVGILGTFTENVGV